ncbi:MULTISPECIES: hypothetical protein [Pseudomonas]|nr:MULTISPECIES: hypothetical protein [Pseudomonas]MCQ4271144.1 hypothetical protein [Pseudomonas kuykendallii]SDX76983.1 hypothetical protein SAMN05216287_3675 [Pseudomonas kuykendallii]
MSFADSMNSLDAMNDDDVVINEIRLPSIKVLLARMIASLKPAPRLVEPASQHLGHVQQS